MLVSGEKEILIKMAGAILKEIGKRIFKNAATYASAAILGYEAHDILDGDDDAKIVKYVSIPTPKPSIEDETLTKKEFVIIRLILLLIVIAAKIWRKIYLLKNQPEKQRPTDTTNNGIELQSVSSRI